MIYESYDLNNLDKWLEMSPYDLLAHSVSDARYIVDGWLGMGFGIKDTASLSSDIKQIAIDKHSTIAFSQLSSDFASYMLALRYLVVIGYNYRQPEDQRFWEQPEDFDFQIQITDNFDAPTFGREHQYLPPLSMLYAISKGFVEYAKKLDVYCELLARPEIRDRVNFSSHRKPIPISNIIDNRHEFPLSIMRIGQTGIAYVNNKRIPSD
ncbi:MAG: hypothetical protein AAF846_02235 [Chloroflexota bacterium]